MAKRRGPIQELTAFMRAHRAYWLSPVIVVVVLLVVIMIVGAFGGGAAAPFIYTLF